MERRQLGKTDMKVSVLGFGGAEIGFENADLATVSRLLDDALDAGLNVIDTAECYLASEELIGQAVAGRRNDYYLFTKCGHFDGPGKEDWRAAALIQSIERSLKRLHTDRVDLVQLHSCSLAELQKGEVIDAMKQARSRGLTRHIGYSGDGQAAKFAVECGQFDVLQTSVNIADQESIDLTLPLANARNMGVIAKRPIANGAWRYAEKPANAYNVCYWDRLTKLQYDFTRGDAAAETALRFTLSLPGVHTAIVGTKKPGRWRENAALWALGPLPADQIDRIRARWREVAKAEWVGQT